MRFFSFFLCGLLFVSGCSSGAADGHARERAPEGTPGSGTGIVYEGESPLTLAPGERARLSFVVTPRESQDVRFALVGDSGDASLDADRRASASDGKISVELSAPSSSRTFLVRAALESGASAEVPVSVSGLGFGSIEVVPSYSGKRTIDRWTATVTTGTTCAELLGTPPPDGPLVSEAAPPGHPIVHAAPVGPALVVTARAGHFAGGCLDLKGLGVSEQKRVTIPIVDRPLDLSEAELSVKLAFDADDPEAKLAFFGGARERIAGAFPANAQESLLDGMAAVLPDLGRQAFQHAREAAGWDALLDDVFEQKGTSPRELVLGWIDEAHLALDFDAGLEGWLSANEIKDSARFDALRFLGVLASPARLSAPVTVSFSSAPDDRIKLGGAFSFSPAALLAEAASEHAKSAQAGASSLGEALALALSCSELADLLAESHPVEGCGFGCLTAACERALEAFWERGSADALSDDDEATLSVTASGEAEIDAHAHIAGFSGSWVGSLRSDEGSLSVKGSASGE